MFHLHDSCGGNGVDCKIVSQGSSLQCHHFSFRPLSICSMFSRLQSCSPLIDATAAVLMIVRELGELQRVKISLCANMPLMCCEAVG